ncbi:MAG: 5'-nucleotidase C-terminal domain-containing protein, partial [Desulfosporosinus sp.]|nr:5'-nucleotidase C-terminal domain-containing protein [Desulfosporosinus sp.]
MSQLVKINNVTLGTINNGGSTTITDDAGNHTVIYQIPTLTGISAGDKVDITAINSAYTTPELLVRGAADIVKTGSIQAARNLGAGQTATVTGLVTCVTPPTAGSYFIPDGTAGICVYNTSLSPAPQQGDMIKVTGPMTVYKGLLEIAPATAADYSNLSSGNTLPDPTLVTLDQLGNYQSQLVKVKNITLGTINNSGNTTITDDKANSSIFYRMPTVTGISAGDKVDITAVVAAYNTPELIARNAADITKSVASSNKTFDIVEVTDLHGNIGDTSSNQVAGVMAENIKDNVYANNPDRTLILSGGDNYQGTAISNLEYGDPVMKIFNYMGFAASALGNHEFDWGLDKVTDVNGSKVTATYPIICANVFPAGDTTTPVFDPYKIFTLDGVKVAVVGGITESTPGIVSAGSLNGYQVLSNVTYINKYAAQAKAEGAQIVIALIHEGDVYNDGASGPIVDIAENLVGVDAVLGGHTHDIVKSTVTTNAGKTIPLEIGNYNGNGYIDLQMIEHEDGSFSFGNANSAYVAENTTSTVYPYGFKATTPTVDPTVKQIVADTMTAEGPILTKVLGSAQITLDRTQADSPYGESIVGNWATDVMRSESKADFAFQNNGGLRCDIPQGQVDMSTIYQFMPFDNVTETCDMTGAQLKVILEEAVADGGMGIQLSGLKFTYDSTNPTGSRVLSIAKSDGTTVDMNDTTTTYKVATNDFMAGGTTASPKDGFTFSDQSSNMTNTYVLVRDALADAVTAAGTTGVTAQLEGRIKNVQGSGSTGTANVEVLATSDIHGHIYPSDYYTGAAANYGLAKVSTYVTQQRALDPNLVLVDNGDTIQGTPLATYYATIDKSSPNPMLETMAHMKYDTWTLGNHEFNYGLDYLNKVIAEAKDGGMHVLSANTYKSDNTNFVDPYYIKSVTQANGDVIKVGILGLTTKCIPDWESPANYQDLHFNDLVDEANKWVPQVKAAGADIVIAVIHSGEESPSDVIPENEIKAVAQGVSGIDVIVAGHTHVNIPQDKFTNPSGKTVLVTEPSCYGQYVSKLQFSLSKADNKWVINNDSTTTVAMDSSIPADTHVTDTLDKPYQDQTIQYLGTVIGQSTGEFSGATQTVEETPIMDFINKVQQNVSGAQLSIAAPLSATALIPKGDVTIKDVSSVYVYENYLYSLKMTGAQLKKWLEFSTRYYKQVTSPSDPIVKNPVLNIPDYNLDQLYGAKYTVDLTQPTGSRIENLTYNGNPVKDTDEFTVAINNYRYNGGGGFMAAAGLTPGQGAIYDSMKALGDAGQVRNLLIKYIQDNQTISPVTANDWTLA